MERKSKYPCKIDRCILILLAVSQALMDMYHVNLFKAYDRVPYMMKPTGAILALTSFVGCGFLWVNDNKLSSLLIFPLLVFAIYLTRCETAFYGIILAAFMFILSYAMPFWMTRISMVFSFIFLALTPLFYVYIFPPSVGLQLPYFAKILNVSLFHRFLSWEVFSEKFFERPFLGWGVETSRYLPIDPSMTKHYSIPFWPYNADYLSLGSCFILTTAVCRSLWN